MKTLLTPTLLDFLIMEGYEYCLSKIDHVDVDGGDGYITLTPIKSKPSDGVANGSANHYLSITEMIKSVEDILVMVDVDASDLKRYNSFFVERLSTSKPFFNLIIPEEC